MGHGGDWWLDSTAGSLERTLSPAPTVAAVIDATVTKVVGVSPALTTLASN